MSVEESIAQLEAIIERRNTLLRQMHQMLQRRNNVASVLEADYSDDDEGVTEFLERYKISKEDTDTGSIALLDEDLDKLSEPPAAEDLPPQDLAAETSTSSLSKPPSPLETSPESSMSPEPVPQAEGNLSPHLPTAFSQTARAETQLSEAVSATSRESSPLSEKEDSDNNVAETVQELVDDALNSQDVEMEDAEHEEVQSNEEQPKTEDASEETPLEPAPETPSKAVRNDVMLSEADPESGPSTDVPSPSKRPTVIFSDISNNVFIDPKYVFRPPTPPPEVKDEPEEPEPKETPRPGLPHYEYKEKYTLPPPGYANQYSAKKGKSSKTKKRDKGGRDNDPGQLGYYKWAAHILVNPVWKRVGRAQKCINSREWSIASQELRLTKVMERIETLKHGAKWALRQPKKQKNLGGTVKSHWDHLMEEMKWMRTDFREERKFKLALAYDLSTAVLEWHAAGSMEERLEKGICVLWKPPTESTTEHADQAEDEAEAEAEGEEVPFAKEMQDPSSMEVDEADNDDDSDDDADADADAEPESLPPSRDPLTEPSSQATSSPEKVTIKTEDPDVQASLEALEGTQSESSQPVDNPPIVEVKSDDKMQVDAVPASSAAPSSGDATATSTAPPPKSPSKSSYAGLRTVLAYSDANAFFFDPFSMSNSDEAPDISNISNLTAIFPDLSMYSLMDTTPPPPPTSQDGKKKSEGRKYDKDDPYRRPDEMAYQKLYPAEPFMQNRVTLLGPLKPAKNWKDGKWLPLQEGPSLADIENPSKITEDSINELFDPRPSHNPLAVLTMQLQAFSARQDKEIKKRPPMHYWSPAEDNLLKHLIDKYQINWVLIAETFNSSRPTISTDIRTPRDCMERWREKWMLGRATEQTAAAAAAPAAEDSSNQITTRGIKRQAAASIAAPSPGASEFMGLESRKRRRHAFLQEAMRKAGKKRSEIIARMQANQRKPPQVHETHAQYAKLPRRTPAELSRMKAEKEAQELQEMQTLARRRQEELHRASLNHLSTSGQTDASGQKTPQAATTPAPGLVQRPAAAANQFVPQIRGMAQQQQPPRPGTALAGASRLSPQQLLQAQVQVATQQMQQARSQQAATAVPQTQPVAPATPQVQAATAATNGVTQASAPHLSPPFTGRETTASPVHSSPHLMSNQAANSPRPPSAQALPLQTPQMQVNAGTRIGYYMPNIPGYTAEQIQHALRMQQQQVQQQQQQSQQQQTTQGAINYQAASNGST